MQNKSRRRFLKNSALLATTAMGVARSGISQVPEAGKAAPDSIDLRLYGQPSLYEPAARWGEPGGGGGLTPLQDIRGIITPSSLHYVISHGNVPSGRSAIDPGQHRLMIHGMVDHPLMITLEELKRLPSVSRIHFLECASNTSPNRVRGMETVQQRHGRTSCSEWTGVLLSVLLRDAGLQKGARWVVAEGADPAKLAISIPLDKALDDALVAYGQNGEAVRPENGYPLRLVTPGYEGINNVKWLRRIKVVDQPYMLKNETAQHTSLRLDGKARWFMLELGPKSVITRPSGGQRIPGQGFYEITGLAWSGNGSVRRVEVSTDGGRTWKDARLQDPVLRVAHTRFCLDWQWSGEETVLQSRCTDDQGNIQPSVSQVAEMWKVDEEYFKSATNHIARFNAIQSWKVTRDGSIQNAMPF